MIMQNETNKHGSQQNTKWSLTTAASALDVGNLAPLQAACIRKPGALHVNGVLLCPDAGHVLQD